MSSDRSNRLEVLDRLDRPDRVDILGVPIDPVDASEAVAALMHLIESGRPSYVVTPNAEMVVRGREDKEFLEILKGAALAVPDGAGVVWASRLLGIPLKRRVAGIDVTVMALREAGLRRMRVYLLGADPEVVRLAADRVTRSYGADVIGFHHGYFSEAESENIFADVRTARPDIILVAMGSPRQELWMSRYVHRLERGVAIGVGGSLDVISGVKRRAPRWMVGLGLEWLYRLAMEPRRIRRMMALPRFVVLVLMARLGVIRT